MTTIVVTSKLMASDTQYTYDGVIQYGPKIFRLNDGSLAGIAGDSAQGYSLVRWLNEEVPNPPDKVVDTTVVLLRPGGDIWEFTGHLTAFPITAKYHAAGSGMGPALGALDAGATPRRALEVAIQRDIYSGGDIAVEYLRPAGKTFAKLPRKSLKPKTTKVK